MFWDPLPTDWRAPKQVLPVVTPKFIREAGMVAYVVGPMRNERVGSVAEQGKVYPPCELS